MGARRGEAEVESTGLGGSRHEMPYVASRQEIPDWGMTDLRRLYPRSSREGEAWLDVLSRMYDGCLQDDLGILRSLR